MRYGKTQCQVEIFSFSHILILATSQALLLSVLKIRVYSSIGQIIQYPKAILFLTISFLIVLYGIKFGKCRYFCHLLLWNYDVPLHVPQFVEAGVGGERIFLSYFELWCGNFHAGILGIRYLGPFPYRLANEYSKYLMVALLYYYIQHII